MDMYVLIIFIVIILFLLFLRYALKNKNVEEYVLGNDQSIGKRQEQEDSFSTLETEVGVIAVLADGMGGYANGRVASSFAVKTFISSFKNSKGLFLKQKFLEDTTFLANKLLIDYTKGIKTGTTLATVIVDEGDLYWVSVGDSAIMIFRNGEFINLNKKHNLEELLKEKYHEGKVSKDELLNNPMKKRLTSFIGYEGLNENSIEQSSHPFKLQKGDKILLCSDGVYNSISEVEMEKVLRRKISVQEAAEEVIKLIDEKNHPKQDNATVIIIQKNY
jgi:serine/threonine protein phosphatase PrpC